MNLSIFIVEDDTWYGELLEYHLSSNPDYQINRYQSGKECLSNLYKNPDIITLDYSLPDGTGAEILKKIKHQNPLVEVVIISGQEDVSTAVELLKLGAFDYIVKDEETTTRLWNTIINIKEKLKLRNEVEQLREQVGQKYSLSNSIKGNSLAIKKIYTLVEKASQTNITVSISGETGTGKELVARAIHSESERKKKPFVAINMAAIPRDLIESELFGYEKGAFTGANQRRIGKFEEANKGTLFLDEIAEIDLTLQTKLLRVLQEREISRLGGNDVIKIDVRILIATHKDLADEVKKGRFREDLYFRIFGLPIEIPPLRDRGTDIILLAKYFTDEFCKDNKLKVKQLTEDAKQKLMSYNFPGNVRELKAVMDLASVFSSNDTIQAEDVTFISQRKDSVLDINSEMTLKEYEKNIITRYLNKYSQNIVLVAEKLDISKSKIYAMIKEGTISI
jgi:DNA-binding NtrC family response regulator